MSSANLRSRLQALAARLAPVRAFSARAESQTPNKAVASGAQGAEKIASSRRVLKHAPGPQAPAAGTAPLFRGPAFSGAARGYGGHARSERARELETILLEHMSVS